MRWKNDSIPCCAGATAPAIRRDVPVVEILSDSEGEQPALSSPAADGNVAQLVDMGFTPDQAAKVRLSEAILSLMRGNVVKAALDEEAALLLSLDNSCRWVS